MTTSKAEAGRHHVHDLAQRPHHRCPCARRWLLVAAYSSAASATASSSSSTSRGRTAPEASW